MRCRGRRNERGERERESTVGGGCSSVVDHVEGRRRLTEEETDEMEWN